MHNDLFLSSTQNLHFGNLAVCLSLLWLHWFLVPAPAPETQSLSTFLKTRVQYVPGYLYKLSLQLSFRQYILSSVRLLLRIPLLSLLPRSHSPSVLHSTYLPYFLSGTHAIFSFRLLYSPPHLWVLSPSFFPLHIKSCHTTSWVQTSIQCHYLYRFPAHVMKFLFCQIYNSSAALNSQYLDLIWLAQNHNFGCKSTLAINTPTQISNYTQSTSSHSHVTSAAQPPIHMATYSFALSC